MTEGPYKLPEGWRWVRLGEVARRQVVILKPADHPDVLFLYLGMENVAPGQWEQPTPVQILGRDIKSQVVKFWPGLVLYGKLRPYLNKVVVPTFEGIASTEFIPLKPDRDAVSPDYLGAYLRSPGFVAYASKNTTGSRQPRVRLDALWDSFIPLPPLDEQRRIVARIEELMARVREAKRLRQQAKEDAERLMQAALAEVFPRPGTEPPTGWRWVRLGEVATFETGKREKGGAKSMGGVISIGGENITDDGRLDFTNAKYISTTFFDQLRRGRVCDGDVLVCKDGAKTGKSAYFDSKLFGGKAAAVNEHVFIVRPAVQNVCNRFIAYWFQSASAWQQINQANHGLIGGITRTDIGMFLLPLPPLDEQRRIVAHLEAVQEKVKAIKEAQARTDEDLRRLEGAILEQAFRGEL